jgi:hypothetical protein
VECPDAREAPAKAPRTSSSAAAAAREKEKEKEKVKSSGTQVTTKEDLLKDQARLKEKAAPTSKDVRAATKKTQYFLTMNGESMSLWPYASLLTDLRKTGPGRPALVPFPRGFKARDGEQGLNDPSS